MNNSKDVIMVARALQQFLSMVTSEECKEDIALAQAAIESLERLASGNQVEAEFQKL
jgi:hypothetical protein